MYQRQAGLSSHLINVGVGMFLMKGMKMVVKILVMMCTGWVVVASEDYHWDNDDDVVQ